MKFNLLNNIQMEAVIVEGGWKFHIHDDNEMDIVLYSPVDLSELDGKLLAYLADTYPETTYEQLFYFAKSIVETCTYYGVGASESSLISVIEDKVKYYTMAVISSLHFILAMQARYSMRYKTENIDCVVELYFNGKLPMVSIGTSVYQDMVTINLHDFNLPHAFASIESIPKLSGLLTDVFEECNDTGCKYANAIKFLSNGLSVLHMRIHNITDEDL